MLNKSSLKQQLQQGFEDFIPGVFEQAMKSTYPTQTKKGEDLAKKFGQNISDLLCEPLATVVAAAIDYYVKNISISGTIITTGSPVTQTAMIQSPSPITNGIVPNSLKIN